MVTGVHGASVGSLGMILAVFQYQKRHSKFSNLVAAINKSECKTHLHVTHLPPLLVPCVPAWVEDLGSPLTLVIRENLLLLVILRCQESERKD